MDTRRAEVSEALLRFRAKVLWRIARKRGYGVAEAEILQFARDMSDREVIERLDRPRPRRRFWRGLFKKWFGAAGAGP